jgi:ABC-2 type transport system ATP-binding protein
VRAQCIDERDGLLTLRLAQPADVGRVLAACAAAGCEVDDLEVGRADLEDVFLQLVADRPGEPATVRHAA